MKVALVYTSSTPELVELIEREIKKQIGDEATLLVYMDPSILADIREAGKVTAKPAARLISMYMEAVGDGADAIINICSSVGEVADSVQQTAEFLGVPIVRIDEDMCKEAVTRGKKIAVMATLPTTLEPTKNTIIRLAKEMNKEIEIVEVLVEGAFGLNQEEFKQRMLAYAKNATEADVILFAQGSMAYCEEYIAEKCNKEVLSSPRFGAIALKEALHAKGVI